MSIFVLESRYYKFAKEKLSNFFNMSYESSQDILAPILITLCSFFFYNIECFNILFVRFVCKELRNLFFILYTIYHDYNIEDNEEMLILQTL